MPDGLDFWNYQALVESNGAQLLQVVDGTYTTGVGSPEAIEAMQLIANMILVDETALNVDWGSGIPAFLGGELAMFMGSSGLVIGIQNTVPFTLGTAPYPVFEGRERRVPAGGSNNFIFATEPEQQLAAFKFIQSLMSSESMTEWVAATGFLPPRPELAEDPQFLQPFYEANPLIQVEFDQVENVVPWVSWPGEFGPEANAILADTRDMILTGTVTTEDGMQSAAQEINELISR
jgi:multiple sugar transport system substrate-binding protein